MLKHVSTLSLDTSRRSLRTSGRLSLAWEDGDEVEMLSTGHRPPASLATLPRPNMRESSLPSLSPSSPWSFRVTLSPESEPESDVELVQSGQIRPQSGVRAIKVYAQCLRPHLSYKTVVVTPHTTSKQVILGLLSRFRMRHRDPNLFYLTMEVTVGGPLERQTILLEDNARPSEMISCNPWGGCKFILQAKQGGLVKVYDHLVRPDSIYKSLIISGETTATDTVRILRCCYREGEEGGLHLWEVSKEGLERRLGDEERPLVVMAAWKEEEDRRLLLRPSSTTVLVLERGMARGSVMRQTIRRRQMRVMDSQAQMEVCASALSLCTLDSDTASELGSEEGEGTMAMSTSSSDSSESTCPHVHMSTSSSDSSEWTPTPGYCSIYISGNGTDSFFT